MKENKMSMNLIMVIVIMFSAITFLFTIKMSQAASKPWPNNEFYRLGDTEYAVRYSNLEPNGIYKGNENQNTLVLKGNYGSGWGAVVDKNVIYTNEYTSTDMGLIFCKVVKIDLDTLEKTVVMDDAVIRGQCKSGEIVITDCFLASSNHSDANSLCKLYALSSDVRLDASGSVIYYDIARSEEVYRTEDKSTTDKNFGILYLKKSLEEVME